jgi:hypothetical protein
MKIPNNALQGSNIESIPIIIFDQWRHAWFVYNEPREPVLEVPHQTKVFGVATPPLHTLEANATSPWQICSKTRNTKDFMHTRLSERPRHLTILGPPKFISLWSHIFLARYLHARSPFKTRKVRKKCHFHHWLASHLGLEKRDPMCPAKRMNLYKLHYKI